MLPFVLAKSAEGQLDRGMGGILDLSLTLRDELFGIYIEFNA